jgi:hypothetical protein
MSAGDIDKFPHQSGEAEGSATDAGKAPTLEEYLRQGTGAADRAQVDASLFWRTERLNNPPHSNLPASLKAKPHAQEQEGEWEGAWREDFATRLAASELRKGLSFSRYVVVAAVVCGVSGSAFFYFLTTFAALDNPGGSMVPPGRAAAAVEYSARSSDPELPAPLQNDDVNIVETLPQGASPDPLAAPASSLGRGSSPAAVEADQNQPIPAESSAGQPPAAPHQPLPAAQTSEASIKPESSSAGAAPAETVETPPRKYPARTASLTPPPGTALLDTAIPGARYAPDEKPAAANGKSEKGAVVPDVQLASLAPAQEAKMLARASELMNQNDIAGARLVYQYLANHGSSAGAFALAESYDARKWAAYHVTGMTPDAGLAEAWYQRAAALGSKEAAAILRRDKR